RERCPQSLPLDAFYARLDALGMAYGPAFRGLTGLWQGEREAVGRASLALDLRAQADGYALHPALLDACFQALGAALPAGDGGAGGALRGGGCTSVGGAPPSRA